MSKFFSVLQVVLAVIGALAMLCSLFANVLPDGRAKTAFSYAGTRLVKAAQILGGIVPTSPSGTPEAPKSAPKLPPLPLLCMAIVLSLGTGCAFLQAHEATIVSDAKIACALENALVGDATIREICKLADEEWAIVQPYLGEHRKQLARQRAQMAAAKCAPSVSP